MTTRGVFRLSSYRSQELKGDGVPIDDVWTLDKLQQKGYVIGGQNQSNQSTSNYQSLDYKTDTRGNLSNLPIGKNGLFGTASPTNGYTYGGYSLSPTVYYSSSNKLVFATETHTELPGTTFNDAGQGYARGGSCGSQTHGYICGGNGPGEPGGYSRLDKMTYATETIERIPGANMPSPGQEYNSSASADGNTAGYWVGGANGGGTHVRKLNFSNDSWSNLPNLPNPGPTNRAQKAGMSSSDTGAYLVGGSNPYSSKVQKITFATGNSAFVGNSTVPTNNGRMRLTGTGNSSSGYFCGGTDTSIVEKMNFSSDSMSRIPAMDLAQGVQDLGSMSAAADNKVAPVPKRWVDNETEFTGNHGYFGMGFPSSGNGDFKKLDFVTETVSPNYQFYSPGRHQFAVGSTLTHGYALGGSYQGPSHSNVYKWDYATNSGSENPSKLSRQRRRPSSSSTRSTGYVVAGYSHTSPSGATSDISKYSFSTDTSIGTIPAKLPTTNESGMGMGTQEFGYHSQGSGTYVWKLDYSSDTVSTLTARLPVYRYEMTSSTMANSTTGYFVGGSQGPGAKSSTDKVDFSTDTISAGENLTNNAQRGQATSNTEFGYVMLGWNAPGPSGGSVSAEMNKYVFTTDTVTAKGNLFNHQPNTYSTALSVRMNNQSGLIPAPPAETPTTQTMDQYSPSLSNSGYWLGGKENPGPSGSRAAKIDFSTETVSSLPNTPLKAQFQGGMSSATYGYSIAGYDESVDGSARYKSQVYKIQYSTDSYSGQGNYPAGRVQGSVGVSAGTTHGYNAGGHDQGGSSSNAGGRSSIHKFTFATNTWATIPDKLAQDQMPGSPVPTPKRGSSGGNREYGYWVAMDSASNPSRWGQMTKIAYSSDTTYGGLPRLGHNGSPSQGLTSTSTSSSKTAMYTLGNWLQPGPSPSKHSSQFEKWTFSTDTTALLPSSTPGLASASGWTASGNWEAGYHNGAEQSKKIVYATETTTMNPSTAFTPSMPSPRVYSEGVAVSARNGDGGKVTDPVVL